MLFPHHRVVVRGAGDLATGVIYRLHLAGFPVIATEVSQPLAVRRTVAFAEAVYEGYWTVEGVTAVRVEDPAEAVARAHAGEVVVLPRPEDEILPELEPVVLVDARLLKRDDVGSRELAPLVIGLGPGFEAGHNCHAAVETNRGHRLGRVLWQGTTEPNTGIPGSILGFRAERVIRAPVAGIFRPRVEIGDLVEQGHVVAEVEQDEDRAPIVAPIAGVVRGLLHPGLAVQPGLKVGDVDPRGDAAAIFTISEKSLAIGGAVLSAILTWLNRGGESIDPQAAG
ncbi:MAG: EF2563 family selenium-dependent molybdenum hydroxylase system protein [Caldilineae bacterium]|nr:MAG: EF2563 family selenium-dependent molybdenum hydroxylase system protein [Caldilineae bacterium]